MNEHSAKPVSARVNVSSGSPYEPIIGFSRAVRVGNIVAVGGTTAGSGGNMVGVGDPAAQTRAILDIIGKALQDAGARLKMWCAREFISWTSPIGRRSAKCMARCSATSARRRAS